MLGKFIEDFQRIVHEIFTTAMITSKNFINIFVTYMLYEFFLLKCVKGKYSFGTAWIKLLY